MPESQLSKRNVAILGVRDLEGRLYTDQAFVDDCLDTHFTQKGQDLERLHVITGGGRGSETLVIDWCVRRNIEYTTISPNIVALGTRQAFIVRNNVVVGQSTELLVFWDGGVSAPLQAIANASKNGKQVTIFSMN